MYIKLGEGRCVVANEVLSIFSVTSESVLPRDKVVVYDFCKGLPPKTGIICKNGTVILTNFGYTTIQKRHENAMLNIHSADADDGDEEI